jgi:hypothetical protein
MHRINKDREDEQEREKAKIVVEKLVRLGITVICYSRESLSSHDQAQYAN